MRTYLASSKRSRGIESRDMTHEAWHPQKHRKPRHEAWYPQNSSKRMLHGCQNLFFGEHRKKKGEHRWMQTFSWWRHGTQKFFWWTDYWMPVPAGQNWHPPKQHAGAQIHWYFSSKDWGPNLAEKMPTWLFLGFLPVFWGHQQALAASRLHLPWTGPASTFFRLAGGTPPRSTCPWGNPCFWTVDWGVARSSERYFSPLPLLSYADSHQPQ